MERCREEKELESGGGEKVREQESEKNMDRITENKREK